MNKIIYKLKGFDREFCPLHPDYYIKYGDRKTQIAIGNLSKTNIFIGENNSGKSRFLRNLFAEEFYGISCEQLSNIYRKSDVYHPPEKPDVIDFVNSCSDSFFADAFWENSKSDCVPLNENNKYYFPVLRGIKNYKKIIINKLKSFSKSEETKIIQNKDSINHYISLLDLDENGLKNYDIYNEMIFDEYFQKYGNMKNNILTGESLYQQIKDMILGDENGRIKIDLFQEFLRLYFFRDAEFVKITPNEKEKTLYIKIGTEPEKAIYDWGDGIQQLITMLFYIYIWKDCENKVFFIEEPETYLHPGILRRFIEVINMEQFKNHQFFITTHSNAILDTSSDTDIKMSIFKFKKNQKEQDANPEFLIEQCNNGDVSLLNELGIRNSSVFLSNCSIWVEGITDRMYFKHYLNLYLKENDKNFRENIDYTFIEYGGGNIVHFDFNLENSSERINAKYINNKIFLITDNDNLDPEHDKAKIKRKKELEECLGDNYQDLQVLEVENLISKNILKEVLIKQNVDKTELIEDAFKNELPSFEMRKLGEYISTEISSEFEDKYKAESGTIKNKLQFCNDVIKLTTNYNMLTEKAKNLVEKIYKFIEKNNND